MDGFSPPASISSSTATAPPSTLRQPTYTTAGTVYNPDSSQPLQAPARRGRSSKWATGGAHHDLVLFPKSVIANLPLNSGTGRMPAAQQYTPLQQNYDCAMSPFNDPHHLPTRMPVLGNMSPHMRSGNTPGPTSSMFPDYGHENHGEAHESVSCDGKDDDSDANMAPLKNLTVKSLHNLASYPNPSQERAQKALLLGAKPVKPVFDGYPAVSRPVSSANGGHHSTAYFSPSIPAAAGQPTGVPYGPQFDHRRAQGRYRTGSEFDPPTPYPPPNTRHPSPASINDAAGPASTSTTLASGPGAPRPLTAGPPGQRQYRSSTFESTFNALRAQNNSQARSQDEEYAFDITRQTLVQAGIENPGLLLESFSSSYGVPNSAQGPPAQQEDWPPLSRPSPYRPVSNKPASHDTGKPVEEFIVPTQASNGYFATQRALSDGSRRHGKLLQANWRIQSPEGGFKTGTDRLTDASLAARNAEIEDHWYSGCDLLDKSAADLKFNPRTRKLENPLGVIGDRRLSKKNSNQGPISMEEAKEMPVSDHMKPLLSLATLSLLRTAKFRTLYGTGNGTHRKLQTPEPSSVDQSAD